MNKKLMYIIIIIVIGLVILAVSISGGKPSSSYGVDAYNASYVIEGRKVALVDGVNERGEGSAKTVTRYFGNEARGDLNGDGRSDVAFLITQSPGGTGTFYYLVAGINSEKGYQGTHAALIGDRIAPQSTTVNGGVVTVNFADRRPDQPFTDSPTVGKTLRFKLNPETSKFEQVTSATTGTTGTVTKPSASNTAWDPQAIAAGTKKLQSKKWTWIKATYNDGRTVMPKKAGAFTVSFDDANKFTATTDCNQMGGTYTVSGTNDISMGVAYRTKMFCEGSEEDVFAKILADSRDYRFTAAGELIVGLKFDTGTVTFR